MIIMILYPRVLSPFYYIVGKTLEKFAFFGHISLESLRLRNTVMKFKITTPKFEM